MTDKPNVGTVDIAAARAHSVGSRRTRAHVIVCHELDRSSRQLYELFELADKVDQMTLGYLVEDLARDIIADCNLLVSEITHIREFAERQLAKIKAAE